MTGLSWRIVSGAVDRDVTTHVAGTPSLSWNSLGGFEVARVRIDLPLSAFPDLGEQARLIVTDAQSHLIWEGYCTDPGGLDTDTGEAFDLVATGAMVLASDTVEPLVYRDATLSSWVRAAGSVETGQAQVYDDDTGTGWFIAHPQGYPIGTDASIGIEYRALRHAAQSIGAIEFTLTAGAADPDFEARVTTYADGAVVDTLDYPLSTTPTAHTLVAGTDFATGVDTATITLVRTGAATNVTTGLSWVRVTSLALAGSRVDRFGDTTDASIPVTSAAVIEDLIGRGMLAQVDPARAVVEESAALHTQLAFPEGVRGAGVISKVRELDPDMVWMYGPRGTGGTPDAPAGHDFTWTRWPESEVRYDITEDDAVQRPGGEDQRAHRISVFYRETDNGPLNRVVVELANPGGLRVRDADPIVLPDPATALDAQAAGEEALARLSLASQNATATVARLILDRSTGVKVEPWEIRPGALARIVATGELLRITEVSCTVGDSGATATLTLGNPAQTLEDRLLAFLRGETDPTAPLIPLPPVTAAPPNPATPEGTDGLPPTASPTITWRSGIGSAFLTWDPVVNADQVSYRVLIGTSSSLTESPSTLAGTATGGFFIARLLPNGTAFQNGVTYYARVIAFDADGDAPAGPVASGQVIAKITETEITPGSISTPLLAANAITTDLLLANDAWIGALRSTDFYGETITGPVIRTAASNPRIELNGTTNTFRAFNASGVQTFSINGSTGAVEMLGTLKAGSDISAVNISGSQVSGGTIAGTIFRTVSTADRGFQLVNYGMYGYDESGNTRVIIETTGATAGRIAVGGYIASELGFRLDNGVGSPSGIRITSSFASLPPTNVGGDLSTNGNVFVYGVATNTNAIVGNDLRILGTNGLVKITSSERYKTNIRPADLDVPSVLALAPSRYESRDTGETGVGFIAEHAHDLGLTDFVVYDDQDRPDSFSYSGFVVAHQAALRDLHARLSALEAAA